MKRVFFYALGLVLCFALLSFFPAEGEAALYDDVIRLHVLAASDSDSDQAAKLAVRDAILASYGDALCGGSADDAEARLLSSLPGIESVANEALATHGVGDTVKILYGRETYPERTYGDLRFPAGVYRSLRVVIGAGEGHNWWCVLYPPLCTGAAQGETLCLSSDARPDGFTDPEWRLVSGDGRYEIRFRVLEWLENARIF